MSKVQINTFTMTDSHGTPLETIKEHALDAAKRREEWDYDPTTTYNNITVEVTGPITKPAEIYYDVKVFGEPECLHNEETIFMVLKDLGGGCLEGYHQCECGKQMKPIKFKEMKNG